MPLVVYLSRRFSGRNEPMNDLVQVGSIGLIKAIDRFDPERGLEFSTYATPTILGELKRHFRDTGWLIHVPRRAQELQTTLNAARADLSQELGRAPTVKELAARIDAPEDAVIEALDAARAYSGVPLDVLAPPGEIGARAPDARHGRRGLRAGRAARRAARRHRAAARGRARDPAAALRREQDADRDRRARRGIADAGVAAGRARAEEAAGQSRRAGAGAAKSRAATCGAVERLARRRGEQQEQHGQRDQP